MDYKDLRYSFCEKSGRYDLINDDKTDNGADFYINAGQRLLDRKSGHNKMEARNIQLVTAGTIIVKTTGLRAVRQVWAGTSANGLIELGHKTLQEMRQEYAEELSSVDQGTPMYYCPAAFRSFSDTVTPTTWSGYYDIGDLVLNGTHFEYNGVIIMPPPDGSYYVSIVGLFYSPTLSATLDGSKWVQTKSFWTEVHPEILLQASFYALEKFYRNSEGAKDWKAGMDEDLFDMDKDSAEEESAYILEMGG